MQLPSSLLPLKQNSKAHTRSFVLTRVMTTTLFFIGLGVLYIWEQEAIESISLKASALEKEKKTLINYTEYLKSEIETLTRFEIIESTARKKLSMCFPSEQPVTLIMDKPEQKTNIFKRLVSQSRTICSRIF